MRSMRVVQAVAGAAIGVAALLPVVQAEAAPLQFFTETVPYGADTQATTTTPLVGDFNGDGRSDLFLYRPGTANDSIRFGRADRNFTTSPAADYQVTGTYKPFVGDFDGNGSSDVFWYAPGTAADSIWFFDEYGYAFPKSVSVKGTFQPLVGDFVHPAGEGDADDIFWYAPGSAPDALWKAKGDQTFQSIPQTVNGTFQPLVGSFTPELGGGYGGSVDLSLDIFWYAPGAAKDYLWNGRNDGTWTSIPKSVGGTYQPVVGLFDGYGVDDIFWYSPTGPDAVWLADPVTGKQVSHPANIGPGFTPIVGGFRVPDEPIYWWSKTGVDDFWIPEGAPGEWEYTSLPNNSDMDSSYIPRTGDFDGDGHQDLFWVGPGTPVSMLWWGPG